MIGGRTRLLVSMEKIESERERKRKRERVRDRKPNLIT